MQYACIQLIHLEQLFKKKFFQPHPITEYQRKIKLKIFNINEV